MLRFVSFFLVSIVAICGLGASLTLSAQITNHDALQRLVAEPLPDSSTAQSPASFYSPDNLYQYMDGGADIFVLYGVKTMLHLDAKARSVDVTVDIFDMGSTNAAFGMYAAERSPEYDFIAMGAEGYRNKGILNFVQGDYYVKLAGFGDGADASLEAWARALSARVGSDTALPAMLTHLPSDHRKPHSEQYIPNDPLGHSFLGPAYVASYDFNGHESKLFVTLAENESSARERLTNAIQPAITEGGIAGLWTPVLKMKLGYCEYECNLCSQVCPTHAIEQLALEEKQKIRIGTAFFDRNRCLPYASARTCIVCEEHCPTPKKAIWFEEVQVMKPDGLLTTVKQPRVDPELCLGCGICENKCPITDQRGVYVSSVGETRNPKNQALLDSAMGYGGE